jgi:hypothetical protein
MRTAPFALIAGLAAAFPAAAQDRFVVADRTNNALYILWDLNHNGVIDEPAEVFTWFNASNAAGTLPMDNPTALGALADGRVVMGDQATANRNVYLMRDRNTDGDALDLAESAVVADATNASAVSFAFPTGVAWDPQGNLYVVNAGNGFGNDGIYRLTDLNADGDFQDAGEVTEYVTTGAFGPGNGPYSPQEIVFVPGTSPAVGLLRNSSSGLHGVFTFVDLNGNGRADDAGEFTPWFDATNQSGVTVSAGFAIDLDNGAPAGAPLSVYYLQLASGGVDQLYRLTDVNGDGDANDAGEAVLVFSTAESGFTSVDVASLTDGRVLVTDNSGTRVIALKDLNADGLFTDPAERSTFFGNSALLLGDLRQIAPLPPVCQPNCDLSAVEPVLNVLDFNCFLNRFATGDPYANCDSSTASPVLNVLDFNCFLNRFAAGCP